MKVEGNNKGDAANKMGEAEKVYEDLVSFLSSSRADLRKAAAEATLATLTGASNNEAAQRLTTLDAILPLCKIASVASDEHGSSDALAALTILCSHDLVGNQCVVDLIESRGVGRMLEIALSSPPTPPSTAASESALAKESKADDKLAKEWNTWRKSVNYACALMANATRTEQGAADFIGLSFPDEAVPSSMANTDEQKEVYGKSRPTATLMLSKFLNPAFIDTTSPAYERSKKVWESSSAEQMIDEYDSDLDDDELEQEEKTDDLEPQMAEPTADDECHDPYQHVAMVIMNITQLEIGRDFLIKLIYSGSHNKATESRSLPSIQEDEGKAKGVRPDPESTTTHLQSLLPQLNSPNIYRRQGIAGTLKNCCFSQDSVWWLLNVVNLDKSLLMTLAGPEELTIDEKIGLDPDYWLLGPQKVREPDALVRLYVAEALLLLLTNGRRARETMRERRAYVIIRLADMVEENERVSERFLECVQYLRRDEEGTEEGSSDRRAYERYARGMLLANSEKNLKALPPSTASREDEQDDDYDGID